MRILHLITRLGLGGAERVAETLACASAQRGNAVTVVPVAAPQDPVFAEHMEQRLRAGGVTLVGGTMARTAKLAVFDGARRLAATVRRVQPDLIHVHTEIPELSWALASLQARRVRATPVVRTVHNTVLWGGWGQVGRFAERQFNGVHVAAVSVAARDAFLTWRARAGASPLDPIVIYNGVDLAGLADGPRPPSAVPLLCYAGRFELQKGIDVLVASIALLKDQDDRFIVEIHGAGRFRNAVERAARAWPDRVTVGPPVVDLRARLRSYDAMLMPSRFEGLPLLAVEAVCAGVPVLATSAPGLNEVLPDWYPGRCRPGDPAEFADLITNFLANPAAWQAPTLRAQAEARDRFSVGTMVEAYERLYAMSAR